MTEQTASEVLGRWRIVEIEGWDTEYVDMLGPGHIQLDRDGGQIEFGAVQMVLTAGTAKPKRTSLFKETTKALRSPATGRLTSLKTAPLPGKSASTTATTCHSTARRW